MAALALRKPYREVAAWIKSITNHLYWCVETTDDRSELRKCKWLSLLDHISNIHHFDSDTFPACEHGSDDESDVDEDGNNLLPHDWILIGQWSEYLNILQVPMAPL